MVVIALGILEWLSDFKEIGSVLLYGGIALVIYLWVSSTLNKKQENQEDK